MVEVDHSATKVSDSICQVQNTNRHRQYQLLEEPTFKTLASGGVRNVVGPALR
jgi:hypothetical protein